MKSILKATALASLLILASCSHCRHNQCCDKCKDSQCEMKKEQCPMKKDQCPMTKDQKAETTTPAKK